MRTLTWFVIANSLVACAHVARGRGAVREPAAVDATRVWSEFGECYLWPYTTPLLDVDQAGTDVFHAVDRASGKDLLTTNPEGCAAHRADDKTRKFKVASIHPKGKLTDTEARATGCLVYGGPIVSKVEATNLRAVKRYGDRSNPEFQFLAFPSPTCDALFSPAPEIAGYVNP